ncbi:MAG TPA: M28 family peptidase [Longimicrobiales bacterium]|nr:M28 family peptidase [Longimicrobiales bacterium]
MIRSTLAPATAAAMLAAAACAGIAPAPPASPAALSDAASTSAAISEADLRTRLYLVADDSMGGRPTGSPGHIKVTEYIASEMRRLGLQPAGDDGTYFQNVPFVRRAPSGSITVDGAPLTLWTDVAPFDANTPTPSFDGAQVIFGGVVNDSTTWISRDDAAGKFVVLRAPGTGIFLGRGRPGSRFEHAAAVAVVHADQGRGVWNQLRGGGPVMKRAPQPAEPQPLLLVASGATKLFGVPWDTTMRPGTVGRVVRGTISYTETPVVGRNVVAILPGSDPALRGQYVAVGAHSDHDPTRAFSVDHDSLRTYNAIARRMRVEKGSPLNAQDRAAIRVNVDSLRAIRPARRDSILNGADDDGSGTVAVLEIAEAMATAPAKPRRSTLFIWHVAEELGLFGAQYFTDNATVPRDSIVAQLNIDMIGRGGEGEEVGGGPTYLQLIGWRRLSNQLGDVVDAANAALPQPFRFDLTYDADGHPENFYCRSDHYMYARYSIPVVFFSTGSHGDYHQVTDEPQYIDYTKLQNVTSLIHDVAVRTGNLARRPVVDGVRPDPNAQCRQ